MKIPKDKLPVITNEMFVSWCNLYNHLYNDLDQHGETLLEDMVKHFEKQINESGVNVWFNLKKEGK